MLLERLGLDFTAVAPNVDERAVELPPVELSRELARRKALAVAQHYPDAVVIGSDQVPALDNLILTKPGTIDRAVAQLEMLAGRTHRLITSVCVATKDGSEIHTDIHRLTLKTLSGSELRDYVQRDQPLDCAGSYKIESLGIALMDKIDGDDFTAITGLPLIATIRLLSQAGIHVFR
jgi:septum formation protein